MGCHSAVKTTDSFTFRRWGRRAEVVLRRGRLGVTIYRRRLLLRVNSFCAWPMGVNGHAHGRGISMLSPRLP